MALQATNLLIQMSSLAPTFCGTPQELAVQMVRRMRIVSPSGSSFFVVGDTEPTSNVGPWLRGGTQWFVFDDATKRYVPLDISASFTPAFWEQASTPPSSNPNVWLRTTLDPTDVNPSRGEPIGWYIFDGANWTPFNSIPRSGTTAQRPGSPVELQEFFDTTINVKLRWERGAWRSEGSPGDIKHVSFGTLEEALQFNPGWVLFGASNQNQRGRYISQATKDAPPGTTDLSTNVNVSHRVAGEVYGETDLLLVNQPGAIVPFPPTIALWTLVRE